MKELSLHILDIVHNSISANATLVEIEVVENLDSDTFDICIIDNGKGMSEDTVKRVSDPFYTTRTTRKVGMGIALFKQNAEQTGGWLNISSVLGKGTKVEVHFSHSNIDRPELGDISGVLAMLITGTPNVNFRYKHKINSAEFEFTTLEIKEALGDVSINTPEVYGFLTEFINSNLEEIQIK